MGPNDDHGSSKPNRGRLARLVCVWGLVFFLIPFCATAESVGGSAHGLGDASAHIEYDYVGVAKCKSCHKKELMGDQIQIWRGGPHRPAWESLQSPESLKLATAGHAFAECRMPNAVRHSLWMPARTPCASLPVPISIAQVSQCKQTPCAYFVVFCAAVAGCQNKQRSAN